MLRRLFNRINPSRLVSGKNYGKKLARYRKEHPESLEEERARIHQWILFIDKRKQEQSQVDKGERARADENKLAEALHRMRETSRAAFMSHPAATDVDFRRCWPSIREELLKQHALEELAGNPTLTKHLLVEMSDGDDILELPDGDDIFGTADQRPDTSLQLVKKAEDSD